VGTQRIQGQAEADGGGVVQERLLHPEHFSIDSDAMKVDTQAAIDGRADVIVIVEVNKDAVAGLRTFIVCDLEGADRGRKTATPGLRARWLPLRRSESDSRDGGKVSLHRRGHRHVTAAERETRLERQRGLRCRGGGCWRRCRRRCHFWFRWRGTG